MDWRMSVILPNCLPWQILADCITIDMELTMQALEQMNVQALTLTIRRPSEKTGEYSVRIEGIREGSDVLSSGVGKTFEAAVNAATRKIAVRVGVDPETLTMLDEPV